jgi:hypothetical protein
VLKLSFVFVAFLSFTACNFGLIVDPLPFPVSIRLESTSNNITVTGSITLTAKIKFGGSGGATETKVKFYDGSMEVGEATASDPPFNSGSPGEYAFQTMILLFKTQNGEHSYIAKALYENDEKSLRSSPAVVNVNIP